MLTDAEYQKTKADLLSRKIPEEFVGDALDSVDAYDAAHKAPSTAGMERSIIEGPTGIDALERSLGTQEENTGPLAEPLRELRQSRIAQGKPNLPASSLGPTAEEKNAQAVEVRKEIAASRDYTLPSASGTKDLYRPPEHIPTGLGSGGVHEALPSFFGGNVDHFVEPGIEQFRRDMEPTYGPKVNTMDESSQAYKEYADRLWKEIHDKAVETGTPVVRMTYARDPRWNSAQGNLGHPEGPTTGEKLFLGGMSGLGDVAAFAHGADEGALAGLGARILPGTDAANAQKLTEAAPVTAAAGRIVGAASPRSIGGMAASGLGKGARLLAPAEAIDALAGGGLGSVLSSGAKGAVAGGVNSLATSGVEASTSEGPYDWQAAEKRAIESSLWGGAIGAGADVLGQVAGAHGSSLRRDNPELGEAERIGGKTSTISGFKPGKDYENLATEARTQESGVNSPEGLATSRLAQKILPETRRLAEETRKRLGQEMETYEQATDEVRMAPVDLLHHAMDRHQLNLDDLGRDIHAGQGKLARDIVRRISSVEAVEGDATATLKAAQAISPGAFRLPADEAAHTGYDVDAAFKRWKAKAVARYAGDPDAMKRVASLEPDDLTYVVTPTGYSPRQWRQKLDELDEVASVAAHGGVPKKGIAPYLKTARDLRDRFPEVGPAEGRTYTLADGTPVKGYSALANEHADVLQELENERQAQGLNGEVGPRPDLKTGKGVQAALLGYGKGGTRYTPEDEALLAAARNAGLEREVRDVRGITSTRTMQDIAKVPGRTVVRGGQASERSVITPTAARLRLDPGLSHLAMSPDAIYAPSPLHLRGGTAGGAGAEVPRRGHRPGERVLTPEEARQLHQILLFEGGSP